MKKKKKTRKNETTELIRRVNTTIYKLFEESKDKPVAYPATYQNSN